MPRAAKPAWQFSLKALLFATTGFAVFCGLCVVLPAAFSQIILGAFWIVVSGWLITGIVFAKGDKRAFCIGATVVATSMWTGVGGRFVGGLQSLLRGIPLEWQFTGTSNLEVWLIHLVLVAIAVANGYLCIRARRYFEES